MFVKKIKFSSRNFRSDIRNVNKLGKQESISPNKLITIDNAVALFSFVWFLIEDQNIRFTKRQCMRQVNVNFDEVFYYC